MHPELAEGLAEPAHTVVASGAISGNGHGNMSIIPVPPSSEMLFITVHTLHGLPSTMVARIRLDGEILEGEVPPINKAVIDMHTAIDAAQPEAGCAIHAIGFGSDRFSQLTGWSQNEPGLANRKRSPWM
jgi:hypothetical protein